MTLQKPKDADQNISPWEFSAKLAVTRSNPKQNAAFLSLLSDSNKSSYCLDSCKKCVELTASRRLTTADGD